MGAIMYRFTHACNPLIWKIFRSASRGCAPALLLDALRLILRVGLDLGLGERQWAQCFLGEGLSLIR